MSFNQELSALFNTKNPLTPELLTKYSVQGPRYTSYPTAPIWQEAWDSSKLPVILAKPTDRPLSIYVHLPFCEQRCLFCSCNVVITQQKEQAEKYLGYLFQEIERIAGWVDTSRPVVQLHWGGGTPTYLNCEQMERLYLKLHQHFTFAPDAEIAIEVDPRVTSNQQLATLKHLGFNRLSLGLQDLDPKVQQAVDRIQPFEMTDALMKEARHLGFNGLNLDLIYGLPHQTLDSFLETLKGVLALNPDRIALYNYAYVPWLSPWQKNIDETTLPEAAVRLDIFRQALKYLLNHGYHYIGMDHFAKPEDELSLALQNNTLHRNFMGYTTRAGQADLIGLGVSAISCLEGHFYQNLKKLSTYYNAIETSQSVVWRGYSLNQDDQIRRFVIQQILCQGQLDFKKVNSLFNINFENYFAPELKKLTGFSEDGLLSLNSDEIKLPPLGRILSRNIAMLFDAYLNASSNKSQEKPIFSKTL